MRVKWILISIGIVLSGWFISNQIKKMKAKSNVPKNEDKKGNEDNSSVSNEIRVGEKIEVKPIDFGGGKIGGGL